MSLDHTLPTYASKGDRAAKLIELNDELRDHLSEALFANRELNDSREQFRSIFENAVEGMYQSSPAGWYVRVNPALARMYGYSSPKDMLSSISNIREQVYVDTEAQQAFARLIREHGAVRGLEYRVRRKDGTFIWISEHARAVRDHKGAVRYYEGTIQDITVRKRTEEENASLAAQLQQRQKMEAIGTLAGGIAHDFNNMLSAIQGFTHLALSSATDNRQRDYLGQVLKGAQRATDLVKQILAYSRQAQPEKHPVNIRSILEEVTKLLRASLPSTIEIALDVQEDREIEVLGDEVQFHQVFMNLATNAAYAMRAGCGLLSLAARRISIPDESRATVQGGEYLEICVSDTGTGIPANIIHRIFEPFFTTKPVGEGTGMGLSVVHGIVRSHNGDIGVTSRPGEGATFRVVLPIYRKDAEISSEAPSKPSRGSERVLVVDDEEALVAMWRDTLSQLGYQVVSFNHSLEALQYIQANPHAVDLLITDQTMPKLTGLDLVERAREHKANLPVVLCSGYGDQELVTRARLARVRFAPKPVSLRDLAAAIRIELSTRN